MAFDNRAFERTIEESLTEGIKRLSAGHINCERGTSICETEERISKETFTCDMGFFNNCIRSQCSTKNSSVVKYCGVVLFLLMIWTILYLLIKEEVLPQGDLFKLLILVVSAFIVGSLTSMLGLPALLGMMLTGIVFKSIHFFDVGGVYVNVVSTSRSVALTVILIKAGLGLDPGALKRHLLTVLKLSLCPCVTEAVIAAVVSHFVFGLPWLWGFMLGFLLSPISPAVVVPTLLSLKEKGYGEDKGIATLVIAASSIDDIFAISLFGIFLSLVFNGSGGLTMQIIHGPLEFLIGILIGLCWGFISAIFPNKDDEWVNAKRSVMIGLGGLIFVLGSKELNFEGAGPLACITAAFSASLAWSYQDSSKPNTVPMVFSAVWVVMQPILFGLIGAEIDVTRLELKMVAYALIILAAGLSIRVITCIGVLFGSKLTWKECLFVNLAWLPKATVQAALGPQPLERVQLHMADDDMALWNAQLLLTVAVIAILITAPIGSLGITLTGTRLLNKVEAPDAQIPDKDPDLPMA